MTLLYIGLRSGDYVRVETATCCVVCLSTELHLLRTGRSLP